MGSVGQNVNRNAVATQAEIGDASNSHFGV
jgi:hypothetical protein